MIPMSSTRTTMIAIVIARCWYILNVGVVQMRLTGVM